MGCRACLKLSACSQHTAWKHLVLVCELSLVLDLKKDTIKTKKLYFIPSLLYSTGTAKIKEVKRRGQLGLVLQKRRGQPAMHRACLLCVVVPSSSDGDLETPLLMVKLIGHGTFQTFSLRLFSTNSQCSLLLLQRNMSAFDLHITNRS